MSQQQVRHAAGPSMSRRGALFAGAGAIAGSAAAVVGTRLTTHQDQAVAAMMPAATNPDVPVMLRLADAGKGTFDIYVGTQVLHVVDSKFAAQVAKAADRAQR